MCQNVTQAGKKWGGGVKYKVKKISSLTLPRVPVNIKHKLFLMLNHIKEWACIN